MRCNAGLDHCDEAPTNFSTHGISKSSSIRLPVIPLVCEMWVDGANTEERQRIGRPLVGVDEGGGAYQHSVRGRAWKRLAVWWVAPDEHV